jgi:hypothetical protein
MAGVTVQRSPVKPAALIASIAVAAFLGLAGCDKPTEPRVCTAIAVDALVATVVDASSGQRICDAKVVVIDGSFSEDLRPFGSGQDCAYSGPTERAGTYEIRATRAGYETGTMNGVRVTRDECHVIPVMVSIQLRKSG